MALGNHSDAETPSIEPCPRKHQQASVNVKLVLLPLLLQRLQLLLAVACHNICCPNGRSSPC